MERDLNFMKLIKMYIFNIWIIVLSGVIVAGAIVMLTESGSSYELKKKVYLVYDLKFRDEQSAQAQKNSYFDAYKGLLGGNSLKQERVFSEEEQHRLENTSVEVESSCYTVTLSVPDDAVMEEMDALFKKYIEQSEKWMQEKYGDKSIKAEILSEEIEEVDSGSGLMMKLIMGFGVGAFLAAFALFVWFVLDTKIRTEEDVVYYTGIKCLGTMKRRR